MARRFDPLTGEYIEDEPSIVGAEEQLEADDMQATPETQPFRFTQNALSGQATGTQGMDARVPIARSPAFAGKPAGDAGSNFILGLPTYSVKQGHGDDLWDMNLYDVNRIGAAMGISQDRIDELRGMQTPQSFDIYKRGAVQHGYDALHRGTASTRAEAEAGTQEQINRLAQEQFDKDPGGRTLEEIKQGFTVSRNRAAGAGRIRGLSDEEALLRGLMVVPADRRYSHDFKTFSDPGSKAAGEDLQTLMRFGRTGRVIDAPGDLHRLSRGRYKDLIDEQKDRFKRGGRKEGDSLIGNIAKMVIIGGMGAMMTGGLLAGPLAPMAASGLGGAIGAGAIAGGAGGLTSSMVSGMMNRDFNLANIGKGTAMGALGGAVTGGLGHAFSGAGAGAQQGAQGVATGTDFMGNSIAQRSMESGMTAFDKMAAAAGNTNYMSPALQTMRPASMAGVSAAQGIVGGQSESGLFSKIGNVVDIVSPYAKTLKPVGQGIQKGIENTQAQSAAMEDAFIKAGMATGQFAHGMSQQAQATEAANREYMANIFQQNPFYDPIEDFESGQAGVV